MVVRKYDDELKYIERITDYSWRIKKGFVVSYLVLKMCIGTDFTILFTGKYEC